MSQSNVLVLSNPYSKWFLLGTLIFISLIGLVYLTGLLPQLQIPLVYLIPIFLVGSIALMSMLYSQGNDDLPLIPFLVGACSIIGGALFDMLATVAKSPQLTQEANVIARLLLEHNFSVEFVYIYAFLAQMLAMILGCTMWASFLRHRNILIDSAIHAKPRSYWEFVKAATGAGHLTWRQCFLPLRLSELPMSYHMVWLLAVIWVGVSPFRWYLGFEWISGITSFRYFVLLLLVGLSLLGYGIWLWRKCPPESRKLV